MEPEEEIRELRKEESPAEPKAAEGPSNMGAGRRLWMR